MDSQLSLAEHYDTFIAAYKDDDPRAVAAQADISSRPHPAHSGKPNRLYASDVGLCPRRAMLRLLRAKDKPLSRGDRLMFHLADRMEQDLAAMFLWRESLVEYQFEVNINDRDNWGARGDVIGDYGVVTAVEFKSLRPNNFPAWKSGESEAEHEVRVEKKIKKEHHLHQGRIYRQYRNLPTRLCIADRGGSNGMRDYAVEGDFATTALIMDELEACRRVLPTLPPVLDKVLGVYDYGKTIKLQQNWECGYCKYAGVSCTPLSGSETWARRDGKYEPWRPTGKADETKLDDFLQKISEGVP